MSKHLIIRNFGPIEESDVTLTGISVIIGPQSAGKSCILAIAAHCSWVEKQIFLSQCSFDFSNDSFFIDSLCSYYNLEGYATNETYIEYESPITKFSYSKFSGFNFKWKPNKWKYKRSKTTYIPAERNLLSVLDKSWASLSFLPKSFLSFMSDWDNARRSFPNNEFILDQRVKYFYDKTKNQDYILLSDGKQYPLNSASSGLQSLIPLFIYLNFLKTLEYKEKKSLSYEEEKHLKELKSSLIKKFVYRTPTNFNNAYIIEIPDKNPFIVANIDKVNNYLKNYSDYQYVDLYIEEPELNLFPPTQRILTDYILEIYKEDTKNSILLSTHSPYIVSYLLEKQDVNIDLIIINKSSSGKSISRNALKEEIQEIYDWDVDPFFNIEMYGEK